MQVHSFGFSELHRFGSTFFDFLALRKQVFVDTLGWDVPHNETLEMDQYDTPVAHYTVVVKNGVVVGGARAMATTAVWGTHTYMLRDAYSGKLPHIPPHVMAVEIASPKVWECTRLVIADALVTQAERSECLTLIVDGLVDVARRQGADEMICLSSLALMRALRQIGYDVSRLGDTYTTKRTGGFMRCCGCRPNIRAPAAPRRRRSRSGHARPPGRCPKRRRPWWPPACTKPLPEARAGGPRRRHAVVPAGFAQAKAAASATSTIAPKLRSR